MANITFSLASLGIAAKEPQVWFKTAAGKGVCNKENFLAAVKATGHYSISVQVRQDDGTYVYMNDSDGASLHSRHISAKKVEPIQLRNKLYAFASSQPNADKISIQLVADTAE